MPKTQASIKALPMATKTQKPQPVVTLRITTGAVSPAQKTALHEFFSRLIVECSQELRVESEGKDECR